MSAWWQDTPAAHASRERESLAQLQEEIDALERELYSKYAAFYALLTRRGVRHPPQPKE